MNRTTISLINFGLIIDKLNAKLHTMKKALLILLLMPLLALTSTAQEKRVKSKVVSATVYTQGAQVTRTAKVFLEKGENKVIFTNLPPSISSVQVNCNDATIVSVSNQNNLMDSLTQNEEYKKLQSRKKELEHKLLAEKATQQTIATEKDVLLANKGLIGTQGVKLEDLKQSLIYIRAKLDEYDKASIEKSETIAAIEDELKKIKEQSFVLYSQNIKSTSEVFVTFQTNQPSPANVTLKYFTEAAGWSPIFDVRAKSINDPLEITCKANVFQTTGEDWSKVKLSVSSGNPTAGSTAPTIEPWFIDIIQPYRGYRNRPIKAYGAVKKEQTVDDTVYEMVEVSEDKSVSSYDMPVSVSESQTNFTFIIDIPYDIPSKQQPTVAVLQTPTLKATYQYSSVPKLSENAYLVANITDWQTLNLTNGDANLYFENNFVGTTYLDTKAFNDTLKLSLGKDESIAIKRTKVKSFTEKNLVGSKITETRVWEITITNGKKQDVEIDLKDQIPVSSNEKVKVKLVEQAGSDYTAATGILKWTVKLRPTETKKIQFSYSVEYPKGSQVNLE